MKLLPDRLTGGCRRCVARNASYQAAGAFVLAKRGCGEAFRRVLRRACRFGPSRASP